MQQERGLPPWKKFLTNFGVWWLHVWKTVDLPVAGHIFWWVDAWVVCLCWFVPFPVCGQIWLDWLTCQFASDCVYIYGQLQLALQHPKTGKHQHVHIANFWTMQKFRNPGEPNHQWVVTDRHQPVHIANFSCVEFVLELCVCVGVLIVQVLNNVGCLCGRQI